MFLSIFVNLVEANNLRSRRCIVTWNLFQQQLVSRLIEVVSSDGAEQSCQVRCLETLRLLSRDRCHLEDVFSADVLASLACAARLTGRPNEEQLGHDLPAPGSGFGSSFEH
ncbi:hypothetical protein HPB50_013089 [Hyalomma asiaticum]|uniref:Uncharacterized protein n=1 Tax=Hyalomma asiaticum TaxID=266040 RepID=A0ACB7SLK2_HYAAI|nr:hypothetical protein HPB50_013089 [Hyalomma asiaticum]